MFTFISKQYLENFAFLVLRILELFARELCKFLKKQANFLTYSIVSECLQTNFPHISKSKRCFDVKSSTHCFHMKTKILADFQICISVPLILNCVLSFLFVYVRFRRIRIKVSLKIILLNVKTCLTLSNQNLAKRSL